MKKPFLYKRTDNGIYTIAYYVGGKTLTVSTGARVKQDAKDVFEKWKAETLYNSNKAEHNYFIKLSEFVEQFYKLSTNRTVRTIKNYRNSVNKFISYAGDKLLNQYRIIEFDRFFTDALKHKNNYTVNGYRRNLMTIFNAAVKYNYLSANPLLKSVNVKLPESDIRFYTKSEFQRLISTIASYNNKGLEKRYNIEDWRDHYKDLFTFAVLTGLRFNELQHLKPEHIIISKNILRVVSDARHKTKGGKSRNIELHKNLLPIYNRYKDKEYLFMSMEGKMLNGNNVTRQLKIFNRLAGNDSRLNFKAFRSTFGMWLLEKGVSLEYVSAALGHQNISTTEKHYAKYIIKESKGLVNSISI